MTNPPIQPALSKEEWGDNPAAALQDWHTVLGTLLHSWREWPDAERNDFLKRHAVAAYALYGQPFGFAREDVTVLRALINAFDGFDPIRGDVVDQAFNDRADSLVNRIEALLPPE